MSATGYLALASFAIVCGLAIFALVKLARVRGAPDRERLERLRVQGNFVPLSSRDIAEDQRRSEQRGPEGK